VAVPELEPLPGQQQVAFTLILALDALRDGLRPFVVQTLQEKEGPQWFEHPRVQRMVSSPPALEGDPPYGPEGPVLDLALLLKLIGSDCYWYRTFRPRLPGISRWQIDSLRELRNRVAHNDGEDPLLTTAALGLPYLTSMEQLLQVIGSDQATVITQLRSRLQRSRRQAIAALALGRSRWSVLFWFVALVVTGATAWLIEYGRSPRLARSSLVIGTPDRRLERYLGLERYLESRLRPSQLWRALLGDKIDVRIEGVRSYPEAVAHLKARRWDVLLGFSPVVSMEALDAGYRPIGRMFPQEPEYRSILFTRKGSPLREIKDIRSETSIALGDFFSATKYYIPMSLLRGRSARITLNLSTAEIVELVRSGKADVGAMAGNPKSFMSLNPSFEILVASPPLPASLIAISPELADLDRNGLQQALIAAPDSVRGKSAANYGPGSPPDYRPFARQVAEGKAFSACLRNWEGVFNLRCPGSDHIEVVEGWIDDARPIGDNIRINMTTADQRRLSLIVDRSLLEQSSVFKTLNELHGRGLRVLTLQHALLSGTVAIESPHQLEIRP
jgi:ABC-type phosphate/phosphonate transport system substrate-binding protein